MDTNKKPKTLAVIGAGPKAIALAAKCSALRAIGYSVPKIHIIERHSVAAHWTGEGGYTNGRLLLGTSPEKDIGFPYDGTHWGKESKALVQKMKDFSWQNYLITQNLYSDWVDRNRPAPEHREWAQYLRWAFEQSREDVACTRGEVTGLSCANRKWTIRYQTGKSDLATLEADGLVLTGPGLIPVPRSYPISDRILTVESFWKHYDSFKVFKTARICLVGNGETAASIALSLHQMGNDHLKIDILSPQGMTFSRGESFRENRVYSEAEPDYWKQLSINDRRAFIYRTDRGVFSLYAQRLLDQAKNISLVAGRLENIVLTSSGELKIIYGYHSETKSAQYDFAILATGSDPLGALNNLLDEPSRSEILQTVPKIGFQKTLVEENIDFNLALTGLTPKLHLPMLSGVSQGPGFANLSCLGKLSDRILSAYVEEGSGRNHANH